MELRQLRYFVAVAEELHFGRAAVRVHIAQPPLSQAIRALEDELGARLFTRTSRSVALTKAGEAFWVEARSILAQAETAVRSVRRIEEGAAGELAVGYMNPAMDAVLCRALAAFSRERPGVGLRLRELPSPAQLEEVRAGRLDLGFIRQAGQDLRGLESVTVVREPYVLALPTKHPLARLRAVPLAEAGKCPLILFPRTQMPKLHDAVLAGFRASGAEPHIAQEVQGKHASLALVAAGLGLCLVPASAREWRRKGVVLRPVVGELPVVEMSAVWQPERCGAAGLRLVELARNCGQGGG